VNQNQIALIEARAYALERPQTTASQLRERFQSLTRQQSAKVVWRARKIARANGAVFVVPSRAQQANELLATARAYAVLNPTITPRQLGQLFAITAGQSRHAMHLARRSLGMEPVPKAKKEPTRKISSKQAAAMADAARRRQEAADYVRQNPNVYPSVIAKLFRVPSPELTKLRKAEQQRIAAESKASNPRRKTKDLHAVFADGSTVDPRRVKDWTNWIGFKEVVV